MGWRLPVEDGLIYHGQKKVSKKNRVSRHAAVLAAPGPMKMGAAFAYHGLRPSHGLTPQ